MKKETKGLVKLRKVTAREPEHHCKNCGLNRYSVCNCRVADKNSKKSKRRNKQNEDKKVK